jgi:hypothetical protein
MQPPVAQPVVVKPGQPQPMPAVPNQGWNNGWQAAPAPDVVVMPPGYLEQPGRFPRSFPVLDPREAPPVGYRMAREARKPLWLSGTIIFSISHAITALVGGGLYAGGDNEYDEALLLMVPLVGPVIWSPIAKGIESDDGRATFAGMTIITAVQATGFGLMLGGFVLKRPVYRRNDVAELEVLDESTGVTLVPTAQGANLQVTF